MVKHTQTIRRQKPTNCLSVLDHFVKLALKGLRNIKLGANEWSTTISKNSNEWLFLVSESGICYLYIPVIYKLFTMESLFLAIWSVFHAASLNFSPPGISF